LFTFWGVIRIIRPGRNDKGVSSHADGSQEESQEESRQEEDQEGEEEEVTSVDSVNVVVFGGSALTGGSVANEGKGRGWDAYCSLKPRPSPQADLEPRSGAVFFCPRRRMHDPYTDRRRPLAIS
jgi:hypothetical protein